MSAEADDNGARSPLLRLIDSEPDLDPPVSLALTVLEVAADGAADLPFSFSASEATKLSHADSDSHSSAWVTATWSGAHTLLQLNLTLSLIAFILTVLWLLSSASTKPSLVIPPAVHSMQPYSTSTATTEVALFLALSPPLPAVPSHSLSSSSSSASPSSSSSASFSSCPAPSSSLSANVASSTSSASSAVAPVVLPPPTLFDVASAMASASTEAANVLYTVQSSPSSLCVPHFYGRWGNHVYMIMMAVKYATQHNLSIRLPSYPAESLLRYGPLFSAPCPTTNSSDPRVMSPDQGRPDWYDIQPRPVHRPADNGSDSGGGSDVIVVMEGFWQYHTSVYRPQAREIREALRPAAALERLLHQVRDEMLRQHCGRALVVSVHVRHGDFSPDFTAAFKIIPTSWYLRWLDKLAGSEAYRTARQHQDRECRERLGMSETVTADNSSTSGVVVLLLSDDLVSVTAEFVSRNWTVVSSQQLVTAAFGPFASLAANVTNSYLDWWLFGNTYMAATSHSSFSHTAILFNERSAGQARFFHANVTALAITEFDPWDYQYDFTIFSRVNLTSRRGSTQ